MELQPILSSVDFVPLDVILEIGRRLDIKSLMRFGSTSKRYQQYLVCNPMPDLYRSVYFNDYEANEHINPETKVDWAQLCRLHCNNRLQEPAEKPADYGIQLKIDYLTNKITADSKHCQGYSRDYKAVAAERPLKPLYRNHLGYYEITVTGQQNDRGFVNFGLTEDGKIINERAIGWTANCMWFGFHGDDGKVFEHSLSGVAYGPAWLYRTSTATVGCLINFATKKIAFTVNGKCYHEIRFNRTWTSIDSLHPVVAARQEAVIEFNFGSKPFKFDVNSYDIFGVEKVESLSELFANDRDE